MGARHGPSTVKVLPLLARWITINAIPPSPEAAGSHTPKAREVATEASTAFPPWANTLAPASAAR
jgi:hypothetical protein